MAPKFFTNTKQTKGITPIYLTPKKDLSTKNKTTTSRTTAIDILFIIV